MRKKICILNTGGTILARGDKNGCENGCKNGDKNGYEAGGLEFLDVFGSILEQFKPNTKKSKKDHFVFADFSLDIITPFSIGSQDMDNAHLLRLGKEAIKASKKYDFIIITHGSDTLEESAFFLSLLKEIKIGVILIASMYPPNDKNYDGVANLEFALKSALKSDIKSVRVAMNGELLEPKKLIKFKSWGKDAFCQSLAFDIGILDFKPFSLPKALPKVAVIYADGQFYPSLYNLKSLKGVVLAGMGSGTLPKNAIKFFSKLKIPVVRSSRVAMPKITSKEVNDKKYGFINANHLSPAKAKVLLMLALSKKSKDIAKYFENF